MLILDDHVINKVRHQMANCGLSDGEMKPASLIKSMLSLATEGKLKEGKTKMADYKDHAPWGQGELTWSKS